MFEWQRGNENHFVFLGLPSRTFDSVVVVVKDVVIVKDDVIPRKKPFSHTFKIMLIMKIFSIP